MIVPTNNPAAHSADQTGSSARLQLDAQSSKKYIQAPRRLSNVKCARPWAHIARHRPAPSPCCKEHSKSSFFQKVFLEPNRPPLETLSKMRFDYNFVFLEGFGYTKNFLGPKLIVLKNANSLSSCISRGIRIYVMAGMKGKKQQNGRQSVGRKSVCKKSFAIAASKCASIAVLCFKRGRRRKVLFF